MHSGKWYVSLGERPAPETPLLASMMMPVALDQVFGDQRSQGQDARRGVTARVGDQVGRRDPFAKQLRQPVNGRPQAFGIGVRVAVPVGVDLGVGQAVVGAQSR